MLQSISQAEVTNLGIGVRIRRARGDMSLKEAATETGVSKNTIGKLEKERSGTTRETLQRLATGFGVSMEFLLNPNLESDASKERILAFLKEKLSDCTEQWTDAMWDRLFELAEKMAISNDAGARFFAKHVEREFFYLAMLRELMEANEADAVIAVLRSEYQRVFGNE